MGGMSSDKPAIGDFMQIPELNPVEKNSHPIPIPDNSGYIQNGMKSDRVWLVDDDQDILTTFQALLSSQDIVVEAFKDSQEALKHFALADSNRYHLVILDIRMPGLNGLQLYYRLKAMNKDIKILFVTALEASEELVSILPGVQLDNILKKPVERDYFISTVKGILSNVKEDRIVTD